MIPILEFSSETHRDIRPGHPVPGIFHPGWYCRICGEPVNGGHRAGHMHEIDPTYISGTFCVTSDTKIPDLAQEIKFVLDNLIITLKYAVIKPSTGTNENKIVSSASIDPQCKRMYYAFEASDIECDIGEERGERR